MDKVKQGKRNRINGKAFELKVRADLEESGWIVDRWTNKVEFRPYLCDKEGCLVLHSPIAELMPAKSKWNNFTKSMMMGSGGFPDFIAFRNTIKRVVLSDKYTKNTEIIGVECKTNGILDKEEKEQIRYYLDNRIFSKILIAVKTKKGRNIVIEYRDAKEYLERMK